MWHPFFEVCAKVKIFSRLSHLHTNSNIDFNDVNFTLKNQWELPVRNELEKDNTLAVKMFGPGDLFMK